MTITAKQVSELREATGCGMMDCKKALTEANGDSEKATDILRKKGMAKAEKRAGRVAAEGVISIKSGEDNKNVLMLEVNCETDFVARDENLQQFVKVVSEKALKNQINEVHALLNLTLDNGKTIEQTRQELAVKIGENINVRRMVSMKTDGIIGSYAHGNRIGVLVSLHGGDGELAKDIAMHIAASKPLVVSPNQVPENVLAKEREIFKAQALESGKPENIVEKMVDGRIKKYLNEISLMGQPFVKNPDITIEQLLKNKNAKVDSFVRFELGEGIEKEKKDFAKEVMEQIKQKE